MIMPERGRCKMLSENIKTLRKAKGLSQEELAIRLNVVRQTVSKWEKGLSVPDADLLTKLADVFEVTVGSLLGDGVQLEDSTEMSAIAEQLSRINEHLAVRNKRVRTIWKVVAVILAFIVSMTVLFVFLGVVGLGV
jgi:putative transcriptional regulator